jgi:rRNA-processing protein FCF1
MKILKLLNKKNLSIILSFLFLFSLKVYSNEPVDIWNIEPEKIIIKNSTKGKTEKKTISTNSIYEMQSEKKKKFEIQEDETLLSKKIEIAGLYDPAENGLTIDMWSNSNGVQILSLLKKILEIKLSNDAKEILNISLLTNSYFPQQNISNEEFLELKLDWLIKNDDFKLMEDYLIKNQNIDKNKKLMTFLVEEYLLRSELEKSCEIFSKIKEVINNNYLSNFNIYCLINANKKEEAQLLFDIKKELGFDDKFFDKKFNYLMGYIEEIDQEISEKSILKFHLSHKTNPEFKFIPNEFTSKNIWRYLSTSNLLEGIENIDLEDLNKIFIIERATHERNYTEKELYDLYKRFQFNINQLLTVKQSYKLLSNVEARALVYQGILITNETEAKMELTKILKDLFIKDGIQNAFKDELAKILKEIDIYEVPSNYTSFYNEFVNKEKEKESLTKIKINNKIIHQSKLLNYFSEDMTNKNIEKDLNDLLKKIKKNKNYYVSTKDIILIESLKSDGVQVLKKYDDLYQIDNSNMPIDIQFLIDNNEIGLVLLRLVEVIGQDEIQDLGPETLYFIVSALNQLDIDPLRNKILLKVLPLKVQKYK